MNMTEKRSSLTDIEDKLVVTSGEREGAKYGSGFKRYRLLVVRPAQGCTAPHREYSQYFVIAVSGKQHLRTVLKI